MTYIELVNRVLRGLREDQVTSVSGDYPLLIGQLVNEAKQDIEDMGPWSSLRVAVDFTVSAGTDDERVEDDTNERSYLMYDVQNRPQMFISEDGFERQLPEITHGEMVNLRETNPNADAGPPQAFSLTRTNDGIIVHVFPAADIDYDMTANFVVPQAELTADGDELTIPSDPVWREALVRAMEERGEEFAGPIEAARARAHETCFSAILRDFGARPLTFEAI